MPNWGKWFGEGRVNPAEQEFFNKNEKDTEASGISGKKDRNPVAGPSRSYASPQKSGYKNLQRYPGLNEVNVIPRQEGYNSFRQRDVDLVGVRDVDLDDKEILAETVEQYADREILRENKPAWEKGHERVKTFFDRDEHGQPKSVWIDKKPDSNGKGGRKPIHDKHNRTTVRGKQIGSHIDSAPSN